MRLCGMLVNVCVPEVAVKWCNRLWRWGKYQGSPGSSGGSMLCLIEPDPLILENKLKICFSLQILTRVAQLKETIAVWYWVQGPTFFPSLFQHNCLWAIHYSKAPLSGAGSPTQPEVMTFIEMSEVAAITVRQSWESMSRRATYRISFFLFSAHNCLAVSSSTTVAHPLQTNLIPLNSLQVVLEKLITRKSN